MSGNAAALHGASLVVDLHADTLLDLASGARSLSERSAAGHLDLPRLRDGGVGCQVFAAYVSPDLPPDAMYARASRLLDAYEEARARCAGAMVTCHTATEIAAARAAGRVAAVLAIENADAIEGDLDRVDAFYRRGVRIMSLTWNGSNRLADGVGGNRHGGLSALGRRAAARMQARGVLIDVSHLTERAFWDLAAAADGPIVATHSNAAAMEPHPRNLTDDQLREIGKRGGVVGLNFYPLFLGEATIAAIARHARHMAEVMGPAHVALGSDFDGIGRTPEGLEDVTGMPKVTEALLSAGFTPDEVQGILGRNALRVFRAVWGA
jgi:membrane dipeptidase